jgi:DNA-binding NarL/FixJ family response regulator
VKRIRILIAGEHPRVRDGLRALLEAQDDLQVVGMARDEQAALAAVAALAPEVVVLDLGRRHWLAAPATAAGLKARPGPPAVAVLVRPGTSWLADLAARAGADALVNRAEAAARLAGVVRQLARGAPIAAPRPAGAAGPRSPVERRQP